MTASRPFASPAGGRGDPIAGARSVLAGLTIGEPDHFGGLTVFPLESAGRDHVRMQLLEEGLISGQVVVREVDGGGSVPDLAVENRSDTPVLIVDGEELVGAMQNRVANLSLLVPARGTTAIPVSCVEAGRWNHSGRDFAVTERVQFSRGRASRLASVQREMRLSGARHSDQGQVWEDIEQKADRMNAHSPTGAMGAIYQRHRTSLDEYVDKLAAGPGQNGALFAIGEREFGLDLFNRAEDFAHFFPKLVRSYAIDAVDRPQPQAAVGTAAARDFLDRLLAGAFDAHAAAAMGHDVGIAAQGAIAGALVLDGITLHLTAFSEHGHADRAGSGHLPSSRRRRQQLRHRREA